jgi:hypothetical protein
MARACMSTFLARREVPSAPMGSRGRRPVKRRTYVGQLKLCQGRDADLSLGPFIGSNDGRISHSPGERLHRCPSLPRRPCRISSCARSHNHPDRRFGKARKVGVGTASRSVISDQRTTVDPMRKSPRDLDRAEALLGAERQMEEHEATLFDRLLKGVAPYVPKGLSADERHHLIGRLIEANPQVREVVQRLETFGRFRSSS